MLKISKQPKLEVVTMAMNYSNASKQTHLRTLSAYKNNKI